MLLKFLSAMSQTSLGAPVSEKSTHVEEAILESRYSHPHGHPVSLPLGGPAFGVPAFWAAGPWMEPGLGREDHGARWCHIRETRRLRSCWEASPRLLSQMSVDGLGFFPTAVWDVCGSWRINV